MSTHPLFAPVEPLSIASLHAATDPIAIADLDEDWAVPCVTTRHGVQCDQPAEWIAWSVACCPAGDNGATWCTPHKDLWITRPDGATCIGCGAEFVPARAAYRLIEPLNRRTT